MKTLVSYIKEKKFDPLAKVMIDNVDVSEVSALINQRGLSDVLQVSYGGAGIIVWVPRECAADDDYAEGYLKELVENSPEDWRWSKIEKCM